MASLSAVEIQATYDGHQPLLSVLEGNLDLEQVVVRRNEYAVKAIIPLDLLIATTELYLFEKFILDPLIEPIADKFNWAKAVRKFLNPIQSFNLVVQIKGGDFIEAPLGTEHEITAQIWSIIKKSLDILKAEKLLDKISKIRFTPSKDGKLLILCYEQNRPTRFIALDENKTTEIPTEQVSELEKPLSREDFIAAVVKRAEEYQKFIRDRKETSG